MGGAPGVAARRGFACTRVGRRTGNGRFWTLISQPSPCWAGLGNKIGEKAPFLPNLLGGGWSGGTAGSGWDFSCGARENPTGGRRFPPCTNLPDFGPDGFKIGGKTGKTNFVQFLPIKARFGAKPSRGGPTRCHLGAPRVLPAPKKLKNLPQPQNFPVWSQFAHRPRTRTPQQIHHFLLFFFLFFFLFFSL